MNKKMFFPAAATLTAGVFADPACRYLKDESEKHNGYFPVGRIHFPVDSGTRSPRHGGVSAYRQGHYQDKMGRPHVLEPVEGGDWRERIWKRYDQFMHPLVKITHDGLSGSVYTVITDQFWEGVGFVTFDRAVEKGQVA